MGRIKSMQIKRTSRELIEMNPDLTDNFEKNKEILKVYTLPDKGTRNKIAGYIARIKRSENKEKK